MKHSPPTQAADWLALDRAHCWHPFTQAQTAQTPLLLSRAQGAYVWDHQGRAYFDAVSSWWVNLHGHAHPRIAQAIATQAAQMEHVMFAGITHTPAIQLALALVQRCPAPLQHVFFSDNGSTACEVALKMACQYWRNLEHSPRRQRFLALQGGYHGDTFGAMAAGRSSGFYDPFEPWLFDVDAMPVPHTWVGKPKGSDTDEALTWLKNYLRDHAHELVAFILEPLVQGAAGMRMMSAEFVRTATAMVQSHGVPVIFDEVMTGFGRTGSFFAASQVDPSGLVVPDLLCLSKGLTAGFMPMGATIAKPAIYAAFLGESVDHALLHGHSYTANPLSCAAALASLQVFDAEHTMAQIAQHQRWHQGFMQDLAHHPLVQQPRVLGTIAAFEVGPADATQGYGAPVGTWLRERLRELGVLTRPLGNTMYIIAPYCSTKADFAQVYAAMQQALNEWQAGPSHSLASEHF